MSTRLHIVVPDEMVPLIDQLRGDIPRSRWIVRLIENKLLGESHKPHGILPDDPSQITATSSPILPKPYELPKIAPRKTR